MSDGYWKDGDVPHNCGYFIEEHELVYVPLENGTKARKWQCPPLGTAQPLA